MATVGGRAWEQPEGSFARRLRKARMARHWSQHALGHRMAAEGDMRNVRTATVASFKSMISKWENGSKSAGELNKHPAATMAVAQFSVLGVEPQRRSTTAMTTDRCAAPVH